jgi:hypothetical protein
VRDTAVISDQEQQQTAHFCHSPTFISYAGNCVLRQHTGTIQDVLNDLLLSRDPELLAALQSVCTNMGISPTICSESPQAASMVARCKFYGVIVDAAEPDAAREVLSTIRASSSSRNAISIVVADGSAGEPGGTFVLRKPVALELTMRTVRAAKGLMLNEFSRYFRHPVHLPVLVTMDSGGELRATSINVSHGGLAIQMAGLNVLSLRDAVRARLTLPGDGTCIETKGKVAWADARGRAGIHCEGVSPRDRRQLEEWLAPRLPRR